MTKSWEAWFTSMYDFWQFQKSHFVICLLYGGIDFCYTLYHTLPFPKLVLLVSPTSFNCHGHMTKDNCKSFTLVPCPKRDTMRETWLVPIQNSLHMTFYQGQWKFAKILAVVSPCKILRILPVMSLELIFEPPFRTWVLPSYLLFYLEN